MGIELTDLRFGPLGPLHASLPAQGISVVLGPNGAGKSLLLRLLDGLEQPTHGIITSPFRAVERAHLFHQPLLLNRTVRDNLLWATRLRSLPASAATQALQRVGVDHLASRNALCLSQGEQQLVALARAVALQPKLLLLDEPTANLSPPARQAIETNLLALRAQGIAMIVTSHDMRQAKRLADHVLFLDDGKLIEQSGAATFFSAPQSLPAQQFLAEGL